MCCSYSAFTLPPLTRNGRYQQKLYLTTAVVWPLSSKGSTCHSIAVCLSPYSILLSQKVPECKLNVLEFPCDGSILQNCILFSVAPGVYDSRPVSKELPGICTTSLKCYLWLWARPLTKLVSDAINLEILDKLFTL